MAYGLAGGLALLLDWATFVALTWLGIPILPANVLARLAGAMLAYVLNGVFTFRDAQGSKLGWRPLVGLRDGLTRTMDYFRANLEHYV